MALRFTWADLEKKDQSMFANCQAGGNDVAPSDVCRTPPLGIPIAYTNNAYGNEAIPNNPMIIWIGGPVHNMDTEIPVTHDDEPGSLLGVASGTVAARSKHITGVNRILINGSPVTRMTSVNSPNRDNTTGTRVSPSQTKILVLG